MVGLWKKFKHRFIKKEADNAMKKWKFIGSSYINFISMEQIQAYSDKLRADVICILPEPGSSILNQQQVLIDERYASFGYWLTEESYCHAGGRNGQLDQGWQYELLIRLSQDMTIGCITDKRVKEEWAVTSGFYTDAYILSRYTSFLKNCNAFEPFLKSCVTKALRLGDAMPYLEGMLRKDRRYWEIYQATQPFLILSGGSFCYNILNDMAKKLAHGLRLCGKSVEICVLSEDKRHKIAELPGAYYQAVIGFQGFLPAVYLNDQGCYLTDLIHAPKLEFLFDHPFWFYEQLEKHGTDFYILTHDENYVKFIQEHEPSVCGSFLMPPGGLRQKLDSEIRDKDVVFLGTYNNYRDILRNLYISDRKIRHMAACYMKYLKQRLNAPAEWAFSQMLQDYGLVVDGEPFARMMCQMGNVCQCIMYYYREKIIRSLLDAGIILHVYGESWDCSPFAPCGNLIRHKEVDAENSQDVLQKAKISLNILAWHKGGCNERIINSMLAGAVVVTDKSSYIEKHFADGRDLCYFDLQKLHKLPPLVHKLLKQDSYRQEIADRGRIKAEQEYSAACQAKRVIAIVEQINSCR